MIFVANTPQLVLTFAYFSYNALFTSICLTREWTTYATKRNGLRLSSPTQGDQRSTFFLQLPHRIAIPLMLVAGLLHWLASQAIFTTMNELYTIGPSKESWEASRIGLNLASYSPLALLLMAGLWLLMIIVLLVAGSMKINSAMPIAGSNSAAIAAACHVSSGEDGAQTAISKVQWGVTDEPRGASLAGHCAFSKNEVGVPSVGEMYQ